METVSITLKNKINEIVLLDSFLDELSEKWEAVAKHTFNINLALEEAVTNVINYAYKDNNEHLIILDFSLEDSELKIKITDDGIEFNPLLKEDPNTELSLEERKIGGLGIFFVKKIMDNIEYERINNKNILTLIKKV
ncbi:MAG TPA: ATP-binding protein [Candidatus Kapabacteria bacterium]|nr:ATP-binding protein [Candidatus Kapabacteria bacterium]HPO62275.1 ATP-binding protein [Candidatus Kapabacteria bacterium]